MIVLRPTLKLAAQLKLGPLAEMSPASNGHADWCVRSFNVGRIQYLFFSNTASLFSIVTRRRGVTGAETIFKAFATTLESYLRTTNRGTLFERGIGPALDACVFARCQNRSVIGSMNDLAHMAAVDIEMADLHPFEIHDRINSAPMGMLQMNSPAEVFATMPLDPTYGSI